MATRRRIARRHRARFVAVVGMAVGVLSMTVPTIATSPGADAAMRPRGTASGTVWLCRPGAVGDPCAAGRAATVVSAQGSTSPAPSVPAASRRAFDCFYVYPTVSREPGNNADLTVQLPEVAAAISQASRFSQVCNVWAPMYRQGTRGALVRGAGIQPSVIGTAYASLLSAWKDYLAHDNHGRPVVFIGHSQGAAMLIRLLRGQVDPSPRLRKLMVSALILGGNVQVRVGRNVGGSFRNIPTCRSTSQTGCVIAYSTFGTPPPATAFFGVPGQGVSLQSGQTASAGQQVACVNPVTFSAQPGALQPYFLSATSKASGVTVSTRWVTYPGLYTAQCEKAGGATWLQVTDDSGPTDPRPTVTSSLGPNWGYHVSDVNLALGNLVADVRSEESSYR